MPKGAGGSGFEATKVRFIPRMSKLILGQAKFKVKIAQLVANCPKFDLKLLPYRVQSAVREEAFQVFVSALGGTDPALTKENMNDLRLLCEEFGFPSLLTQVSDFRERVSVVDDEAQRRDSDIPEENSQIRLALCPLQEALSGLRTGNLRRAQTHESLCHCRGMSRNCGRCAWTWRRTPSTSAKNFQEFAGSRTG